MTGRGSDGAFYALKILRGRGSNGALRSQAAHDASVSPRRLRPPVATVCLARRSDLNEGG